MSTIFADKFKNTSGGNTVQINQLRGIDTAGSITLQGEGTATTNLQQGLAKAWSHLDVQSGTPSAADSFNIASVTDNATGNTTNTFTNAMNNDNYSVPSSCNAFHYSSVESYATTGYRHRTANTSASQTDRDATVSAAFGDLA